VVEMVVEAARGRVPVVAGTGSNNTREAVDLTRHAREAGADGALLISPYYNKPTQEGIFLHYQRVAAETGFPMIVYNIPGRTASTIEPETLVRLSELEQVVGVKEASGSLPKMAEVIARAGDDFAVLAGDDAVTLPLLAIGGKGVIAVTANVAPREMVEVVRAFEEGDLARSRAAFLRLLPLFDALFTETNPIPVKAAVSMLGLATDELRLPLTPLPEPLRERLQVVMKELGLLR